MVGKPVPTAEEVWALYQRLDDEGKSRFLQKAVLPVTMPFWLGIERTAALLRVSKGQVSRLASDQKLADNGKTYKGRRFRADSVLRLVVERKWGSVDEGGADDGGGRSGRPASRPDRLGRSRLSGGRQAVTDAETTSTEDRQASLPVIELGRTKYTVLFPDLLPPLTEEEDAGLEESTRTHGVLDPVTLDENNGVIDGAQRLRKASLLGLVESDVRTDVHPGLTPRQKKAEALIMNAHRRHLTSEQRQEVIAHTSRAAPHKSNRRSARETGADNHTAARVCEELEGGAERKERKPPSGSCHASTPVHRLAGRYCCLEDGCAASWADCQHWHCDRCGHHPLPADDVCPRCHNPRPVERSWLEQSTPQPRVHDRVAAVRKRLASLEDLPRWVAEDIRWLCDLAEGLMAENADLAETVA